MSLANCICEYEPVYVLFGWHSKAEQQDIFTTLSEAILHETDGN